jgi:hypothetical protein
MSTETLVFVLIVMQAITVGAVYLITRLRNPQPVDFPAWIRPLVPLVFTALLMAASKTETEEDDRLILLWKQAIEGWLGSDKLPPSPPGGEAGAGAPSVNRGVPSIRRE